MIGRKDRGENDESGLALVSVLWALSILSLIAASVLSAGVLSSRLERNNWVRSELEVIADAAVSRAIVGLLDVRPEERWRVDGVPQDFEFRGIKVRVAIQDELGKIDLNAANDDLIRGLFRSLGLPPAEADAMADRVLDWRAASGLKRISGADREDYRAAGSRFRPRGAAFQSVDELKLVLGMTPALFARIEPAVTVYSQKPTVDPQTAPEAALLALPAMDARTADDMIAARNQSGSGSAEPRTPAGVINPAISMAGRAFMIDISLNRTGMTHRRKAVVRLTDDMNGGYWMLAWD